MPIKSILEHLPPVLPTGETRTTEEHTFEITHHDDGSTSTKYVYHLDKAPIDQVDSVVGTSGDRRQTFEQGVDYAVVDSNGDGSDDAVDFSIGGDDPDEDTTFEVTYVSESILSRYVSAHDEEMDTFEGDIQAVIESRQIDRASGKDLDRIGALFGDLGKRRGRNDEEYRVFIKSIVQSFQGQGTKPGMKFAIAAGIGTSMDNVIIEENYEDVGYTIRIENVNTQFLSTVVADMAELADPSGVELLSAPVVLFDGDQVVLVETESTVTSDRDGLGANTLTMDGASSLQ